MAHASGSLSRFQQKSHVPCAIRASVAAVGWTASQASVGKRSGEWVTQSIFVPVLAGSRARSRGVDLNTSPAAPSLIITPRRCRWLKMNTGAAMAGFHVRAARAVAQIIYAVRAQVLNQLVCSDHVRVSGCQYRLIIPLTRLRHCS